MLASSPIALAAHRRRASVLVLVMTILGVLFVTGIAFMATMNYEAKRVAVQQESERYLRGVDQLETMIDDILRERFIKAAGQLAVGDSLGTMVPVGVPPQRVGISYQGNQQLEPRILPPGTQFQAGSFANMFVPALPVFVEVPGGTGFIASAEPEFPNSPNNPGEDYTQTPREFVYRYMTDAEVLLTKTPSHLSNLRTVAPVDPGGSDGWASRGLASRLADADGDGIRDTWQANLADLNDDGIADSAQVNIGSAGVRSPGLSELSRLVNDPELPNHAVYLGLRIVPHGAFVNLNHAHPLMIANVFDAIDPADLEPGDLNGPYSPMVEEASLRRRGFIPPRYVHQSAIQGSALISPNVSPWGGGDFSSQLFGTRSTRYEDGETVFNGQHRYWMYTADEADNVLDPDLPVWSVRMDRSKLDGDRRGLVSTVSHEGLFTRGAVVAPAGGGAVRDAVDLMRLANLTNAPSDCPDLLPFEYPDYPHTLANDYAVPGGTCECPTDPNCRPDLRKGRLQLSLPWLRDGLWQSVLAGDGTLVQKQARAAKIRTTLIQDAFTLMLLRVHDNNEEFGQFMPGGVWSNQAQLADISRAAAALTANLLDFADDDVLHRPTAVLMRNSNLNDMANAGRKYSPPQAMIGLEYQPYITEVVSQVDDFNNDGIADQSSFFAIELFNPYSDYDIPLDQLQFYLSVRPVSPVPGMQRLEVPLTPTIGRGDYFTFYAGDPANNGLPPTMTEQLPMEFSIDRDSVVYLFRKGVATDDAGNIYDVAVDQFDLTGSKVGWAEMTPPPDIPPPERPIESVQRVVSRAAPWTAPVGVPVDADHQEFRQIGGHTLNADNSVSAAYDKPIYPVQIEFANSVNFVPGPGNNTRVQDAFPTTGTLLLLSRFANRPYTQQAADGKEKLAFTAFLFEDCDSMDNGHMPVFDVDHRFAAAANAVPGVAGAPAPWPIDRPGELYHLPWGQLIFDYFTALPLSNPGPYENLDGNGDVYETAGPKVDMEGLRVHGRINLNAAPWKVIAGLPLMPASAFSELSQSLRSKIAAFARLEPNTAKELGEPLAKAIVAYRDARQICDQVDNCAGEHTGNYAGGGTGNSPGRGWTLTGPLLPLLQFRRGTGFLSVGELANVRHPEAFPYMRPYISTSTGWLDHRNLSDSHNYGYYSPYAMDSGMTRPTVPTEQRDFVAGAARLIALGDWVTVRSDVFTVYASIRGELPDNGDPAAVDARALRLQKTVDRLPMFMGAPESVTIGEPVLGSYRDVEGN